jgi:hypothetical protein
VDEAHAADAHTNESEVRQVIESADFIATDKDPNIAADAVVGWLTTSHSGL